jgi:hypothetical protein
MDSFSMRGAWSFGYRFFAQRPGGHLLVLIGIGVILPCLLQYVLAESAAGMPGPGPIGPRPLVIGAQSTTAGILAGGALLFSYFLQLASWFMSWRLGFAAGRPLGGAILFGLLAALIAAGVFALVGGPALWAARAATSSGIPFIGLLIALIPLVMVFALFYTLPAALLATIASIVLVFTMIVGTVTGNVGMAATLIGGGSGAIVVLFLVMSAALMWLATRLSCTTSVMADWKSCNLLAAMRESWRLTLEDQWIIMRYLALIAFGLAILIIAASLVAGIGAAAYFQANSSFQGSPGIGGQIVVLLVGVVVGTPLAFLVVLLPAGIYRELTRSSLAAEVFA